MADNSDGMPSCDIVSKHAKVLISNLKGRRRKHKAATPKKRAAGKKPKLANPTRTYRDIFA